MNNLDLSLKIRQTVALLKQSKRTTAFTGAGISVESGIPPFRGKNGLWSKFDPKFLDINFFHAHPEASWKFIKQIFFDHFGKAQPNPAHLILAKLEQKNMVQSIITQNIDNLHQKAGSQNVYEFHGNSRQLVCTQCGKYYQANTVDLNKLPPRCESCQTPLKPDFIFFGEPIPEPAQSNSYAEIQNADVFLVIGTTGEIMPASVIPINAAHKGKKIIEINVEPSNYTHSITDIFLQGKASEILELIYAEIEK